MDANPEFPWAVDIPIPGEGLGPLLPVLLNAAQVCSGGAMVTTYSISADGEVCAWFNRVATKTPMEAQRIAKTFQSVGARTVR